MAYRVINRAGGDTYISTQVNMSEGKTSASIFAPDYIECSKQFSTSRRRIFRILSERFRKNGNSGFANVRFRDREDSLSRAFSGDIDSHGRREES